MQHTRRPGEYMGETVLTEGSGKLCAFSAVMQLKKGGQTLFEKYYPREEWQRTYITIYERPLWKTSQAILQDLATGVRQKAVPLAEVAKAKRKASKVPRIENSSNATGSAPSTGHGAKTNSYR